MGTHCGPRFLGLATMCSTWAASLMRYCPKRCSSHTPGCRLRQSGCLHQIGNCAANLTLRFDGYRRLFGSRRAVVPCAQRTGSTYSGLDARCTLGWLAVSVPYAACMTLITWSFRRQCSSNLGGRVDFAFVETF